MGTAARGGGQGGGWRPAARWRQGRRCVGQRGGGGGRPTASRHQRDPRPRRASGPERAAEPTPATGGGLGGDHLGGCGSCGQRDPGTAARRSRGAPARPRPRRWTRRRCRLSTVGERRRSSPPARRSTSPRPRTSPSCLRRSRSRPQPGAARRVVLSLGADSDTDSPLPDIAAGDRLEVLAELELTTDAADPNHPGLIGNAYSYAPDVEATLLLAADASVTEAGAQAIELAPAWRSRSARSATTASSRSATARMTIPAGGLPWGGPARDQPRRRRQQSRREGGRRAARRPEREDAGRRPGHVRDPRGAFPARRARRRRRRCARRPACAARSRCRRRAPSCSPQELAGLVAGERLLIKARLATDAAGLPAPARISTRLFIGDSPTQDEPGGAARPAITWKGNLSKYTGFNCLPAEGPMVTEKYGVATVRQARRGQPVRQPRRRLGSALRRGRRKPRLANRPRCRAYLEVTRLGAA